MRRRRLLGLLGGAAVAWPISSSAQQSQKPRRIGFVHSGIPVGKLTETGGTFWIRRFYEELRRLGRVEGSDLIVERFSAEGRTGDFDALAAKVVSTRPDVIVMNNNFLVKAFARTTANIPIVAITGNPLAAGLVKSLARPGGNLTGVSIDAGVGIAAKRLQILKEIVPSATRIAYLLGEPGEEQRTGITLIGKLILEVNEANLGRTFAEMAQAKIEAVVIGEAGNFLAERSLIVELAGKHSLPAIYPYRDYVEQGGLISYAPDLGELARRMANDVHEILGGAKPGDIPFYLPTKFELLINLKTANALGLTIPPLLLTQADEVIE